MERDDLSELVGGVDMGSAVAGSLTIGRETAGSESGMTVLWNDSFTGGDVTGGGDGTAGVWAGCAWVMEVLLPAWLLAWCQNVIAGSSIRVSADMIKKDDKARGFFFRLGIMAQQRAPRARLVIAMRASGGMVACMIKRVR